MKPSEIKPGRTYVGHSGKPRRVEQIDTWVGHPRYARVFYSLNAVFSQVPFETTIEEFAAWASREES